MDFELSEDQVALQEGIRAFCDGRFDIESVRSLMEQGGIDRARWQELGEMGVFSLRLPESEGGAGLGHADAVVAFEELGRAIVPGPLVWTHLAAGLIDGAAAGTKVIGGIERHDPSGLVEHLPDLDVLVVLDDDGIFHVDPSSLDAEPIEYALDPLVPVHKVASIPQGDRIAGDEVVAAWRDAGATLTAGYLLGVAQGATALAVAYAMEREQFNRPIGSFQAIKHLCADMVVRNEVARAAAYAAGVTLDDPEVGPIDRAVTSAKLMANEAAIDNGKTGVQVHGGMGYTWEVDAHLFFKRAYALEPQFGSREECADRMAALVDARGLIRPTARSADEQGGTVQRDDFETARAVHDLLDALKDLDTKFFEGEAALGDEVSVLEGYQWIFSILQVALDTNVWADKATPNFVDIVGRYKKWGGDNADAFYQYTPIDPARTYRVRGRRGDAVYLSLTVYGGPDDGHYSERIVGSINDRKFTVADDGSFEFLVGPEVDPAEGIRLEPDAVAAIARDYLADPATGVRATWTIDAVDPQPDYRVDDADLARRFRIAATWVRDQAAIVPLAPGEPNTIDEPYPVPTTTFGWAAGDASYAMGRFELADDEAMIIEGTSPRCVFWNVCLWNPFLHTYNYDYDRVTLNGHQVGAPTGGPFTVVVSERDPGHPNWMATQGHRRGLLWFRWFLPDATPERPTVRVVPVDDVATELNARS